MERGEENAGIESARVMKVANGNPSVGT